MRSLLLPAALTLCLLGTPAASAQDHVSVCPAGTPATRPLAGQVWRGIAIMNGETPGQPHQQWDAEFRADGVLVYTYGDGRRFDNGTWRQNDRVVMFETNQYFSVNTATICGDVMEGDRRNMRGESGTVRFTRVRKGI